LIGAGQARRVGKWVATRAARGLDNTGALLKIDILEAQKMFR
jgi:hypothetical protein